MHACTHKVYTWAHTWAHTHTHKAHTCTHTNTHTVHTCTQTVHTYLLFFLLERENGWLANVSGHKFANPPPTTGKVQMVLSNMVGEVSQAGIFPTLFQSLIVLVL